MGSSEYLEKVKLQQPSKTRQTTPLSPLSERQNPRTTNQKPHSRSGSRSVSKDKNGKKLPPGKAAIKKIAGLRMDPSLPRDQQLEMKLSLPDLSNTDVLMIKLKHRQEDQSLTRRSEKDVLIHDLQEHKKEHPEEVEVRKKHYSSLSVDLYDPREGERVEELANLNH